ncbi:MAG: hypothetical protein CL568_05730 [Alphaproteobacteria bacterium]|nr:hypothetical protein [Alphaproteobacteria bacterium]PPR12787.1 MAG: hypothetical protein CFH42_01762 [Alphaproteobacteria bacterium MarineAlpha12_Bin1]|tara:strand:+ start:14243 stop:15319 length:1077 start_codon:yes stop_codon:yes gene_type:complete
MRSKNFKILIGFLFIIITTLSAFWFFLTYQAQTRITDWAASQSNQNIQISWQDIHFTGYPFKIRMLLERPEIRLIRYNRKSYWKSSSVIISSSLFSPKNVVVSAPGSHKININLPKNTFHAAIEAEEVLAQSINFPTKKIKRKYDSKMSNLIISPNNWRDSIGIDNFMIELSDHSVISTNKKAIHPIGKSLSSKIEIKGINIPSFPKLDKTLKKLGTKVESVSGKFHLKGELGLRPFSVDQLRSWRDKGGTIELDQIKLVWGSLIAETNGTLALDKELQFQGSFATNIRGLDDVVNLLEKDQVLNRTKASFIKLALPIFIQNPEKGAQSLIRVPMTLQNRHLKVGPVTLAKFPKIKWN